MARSFYFRFVLVLLLAVAPIGAAVAQAQDPLPSWNEGANKKAILDFVAAVTEEGGKDFVPIAHRIATFDMDGTLLVEHPQASVEAFAEHYLSEMVRANPNLNTQPYRAVRDKNTAYLAANPLEVMGASGRGLTNAEYREKVRHFAETVIHPRFGMPYGRLFYQPMIELIRFLEQRGFAAYIVSGSKQEFTRGIAAGPTGLPLGRIIGTQVELTYATDGFVRSGSFRGLGVVAAGKPLVIEYQIGVQPIFAFGNSAGDQEMLEYAAGHPNYRSLALWLDHDDEAREYVYDGKVRSFPGLLKVSMKDDFGRLFAGQ